MRRAPTEDVPPARRLWRENPAAAWLLYAATITSLLATACWLAAFITTLLTGTGAIIRVAIAHDAPNLFALFSAAAFIPSLALFLGVISGTGKFFEGFYTFLWYVGPMNRTYGFDYTGASSGPYVLSVALKYLAVSAALCAAAYAFRARQLRGN